MILKSNITSVRIESRPKQSGNAIKKEWYAPFNFYAIADFDRVDEPEDEWKDYYEFTCKVVNLDNHGAIIEFGGHNRCNNPCTMRVLPEKAYKNAKFNITVRTSGRYEVIINGAHKASFRVLE